MEKAVRIACRILAILFLVGTIYWLKAIDISESPWAFVTLFWLGGIVTLIFISLSISYGNKNNKSHITFFLLLYFGGWIPMAIFSYFICCSYPIAGGFCIIVTVIWLIAVIKTLDYQ